MSKKIDNVNNIVRNGDLISKKKKLTHNLLCSHNVTVAYLNILLAQPVDDSRVETSFSTVTARGFFFTDKGYVWLLVCYNCNVRKFKFVPVAFAMHKTPKSIQQMQLNRVINRGHLLSNGGVDDVERKRSAMYDVLHYTVTERVMTQRFAKRYEVSQITEDKIGANSMHGINMHKVLVRKISMKTTLNRCKCRLVFYGM